MRSIVYILLCGIILLSSCGRRGQYYTQFNQTLSDTTVHIALPLEGYITGLDVELRNNSNRARTIYISPENYDFRDYNTLVQSIGLDRLPDERKAEVLFNFVSNWTSHSSSAMQERLPHDPLRLLNSFKSGLCDDRNAALANLFTLAGLESRMYHLNGHVVAEAYYDSAWHMYDTDWRVFFKDSTGKVASVEYLSKHPEAIVMDRCLGYNARNTLGPPIFRYLYGTADDNKVNTWFTDVPLNYKNELQLQPGDALKLHVEDLGWEGKLRMLFGKHAITAKRSWGSLERQVEVKGDEQIYAEASPYAITNVSITNYNKGSKPVAVYCSIDSNNWVFKGVLGGGSRNVTFAPTDVNGEHVVFTYQLKFVPVDSSRLDASYGIKNAILFSELVLTGEEGFRVIPATGAGAIDVDVKLTDTKHRRR